MNTHTITADPKQIEELYNTLMWEIEPELTTELLPDLDFLYENESAEDREARLEWYEAAYEMLTARMSTFIDDCSAHVKKIKDGINTLAHKDEAGKTQERIADIEQSLNSL